MEQQLEDHRKMADHFVHPAGICESQSIGRGTRIWAFAHVLPAARIGADCNICDGVFIENDVSLGNRVTVKCGVQLWDGITLEDDVFIGPNATFTNDPFPRSRQRPNEFARTIVRAGASIGANATILPGIEIGAGAMIGAGAVVTKSVPANSIVVGNPARVVGFENGSHTTAAAGDHGGLVYPSDPIDAGVGNCRFYTLKKVSDPRGSLVVADFLSDLPFVPKRYFLVCDVPQNAVRGEHAHRACHQFLVCVSGFVSVHIDDGQRRSQVLLNRDDLGLHVPPLVWGTQYRYSPGAVLMVLASHSYDATDYIRDYREFLAITRSG
jgi:acetyltransferase-like isoleucine patch superfamily enzyme/dTDP-4-dehydrorhamnose 3,5-epimerase-like enzyme